MTNRYSKERYDLLEAVIFFSNARMYAHSTLSGGDLDNHLRDANEKLFNALEQYIDSRIDDRLREQSKTMSDEL